MRNNTVWFIPVAVIAILVILATAFYPAYNPKPKAIPVAILNEDHGMEMQGNTTNIGEKLVDKLEENNNSAIQWEHVENRTALDKGIKNNDYVGGIVFEQDFSKNAMSQAQSIIMTEKQKEMKEKVEAGAISLQEIQILQKQMEKGVQVQTPKQAHIEVITNQGSQTQVANIVQQALTKTTAQLNDQISRQNAKLLATNNINVPSNQFEAFAKPIKVTQTTLNEVKDHQGNGNAAAVMFLPIWLSSMITAVLAFLTFKNRKKLLSHNAKLWLASKTVISIVIAAFLGAFSYVAYTGNVLGFDFNQPFETASYIAVAIIGFSLLILGFMVWIGFPAVPIFMLFVFFSMQLAILPVYLLSDFYRAYIIPWNPFYHYVATLKGLLYDGQSFALNGTIWMFITFSLVGMISLVTAIYTKNNKVEAV